MQDLQKFNDAKVMIDSLTVKCQKLVVSNKQSLDYAKDLAKEAQKVEKMIEDKRKEITVPILDFKRSIDDHAKKLTEALKASIKNVRTQILTYETELERARQEELRKIEAERQKIEEEKRKLAESQPQNGHAAHPVSMPEEMLLNHKVKELEQDRSKSIRYVWRYKIIDEALVPREFLSVDERKITASVAAGIRTIAGIEIYQEEQLVLR
jgi:type I site-specific restriction-modification system R (restriction) subunit